MAPIAVNLLAVAQLTCLKQKTTNNTKVFSKAGPYSPYIDKFLKTWDIIYEP